MLNINIARGSMWDDNTLTARYSGFTSTQATQLLEWLEGLEMAGKVERHWNTPHSHDVQFGEYHISWEHDSRVLEISLEADEDDDWTIFLPCQANLLNKIVREGTHPTFDDIR